MSGFASSLHNKSGKAGLSLLEFDDATLLRWESAVQHGAHAFAALCPSPCLLMATADGRFTADRVKVAYGYQLVAFAKFGRAGLAAVAAAKKATDLTISHVCGTRNCVAPDHLLLEPKAINDERTHCHFVLQRVFARSGQAGVAGALQLGVCAHVPMCATVQVAEAGVQQASSPRFDLKHFIFGRKHELETCCTRVTCRKLLASRPRLMTLLLGQLAAAPRTSLTRPARPPSKSHQDNLQASHRRRLVPPSSAAAKAWMREDGWGRTAWGASFNDYNHVGCGQMNCKYVCQCILRNSLP